MRTLEGLAKEAGRDPAQLEIVVFPGLEKVTVDLIKRYRDAGLGDPEDRWREAPAQRFLEGFSPAALARLREIRDELRRLRETVEI